MSDLVDFSAIADRLNVKVATVRQWDQRKYLEFPDPELSLATGRLWNWDTIERWAKDTGRL